jgi:CDP-diglyceride synthetase
MKTVEGAGAGVAFAVAIGTIAGMAVGAGLGPAVLGSAWVAAGALAGDLAFSSTKRARGAATFGASMGSHGGVFDRFDGFYGAALAMAALFIAGWLDVAPT